MKILLFGATGMVGQGVLREALLDPEVERVLAVGRASTGQTHAKLAEAVVTDLFDLSGVASELRGYDACLFCLGVSSSGMSEADYTRVTHDLALSVASAVLAESPAIAFLFISGGGTDSTGKGSSMWARVKGQTENDLLAMPFPRSFMLRPALIRPLHGIVSRTASYRVLYAVLGPIFPLLRAVVPAHVTTTEELGRAMLSIARNGADKRVLENRDLVAIGQAAMAAGA